MKKIITYFCFSLLPFVAFSQFNTSIDFISSVDYTYRPTSFIADEDGQLNFRIGGNFNFRIFDKITMKTGIRYAQIGSTLRFDGLRFGNGVTIIGGSGSTFPNSMTTTLSHISTTKRYIEIPLIARFEFGHKKLSYYFEAGVSPHLYFQTKNTEVSTSASTSTITNDIKRGEKRLLLGYVIGFGLNYGMSEKMQLFVQPTMRVYTNSSDPNGFVRGYRSLGLEFGFRRGISFVDKTVL